MLYLYKTVFLYICFFATIFSSAFAQQTPAPATTGSVIMVDVGAASARKFRMAISPFVNVGVSKLSSQDMFDYHKKLSSLFAFTDSFDVMPITGFLAPPDAANKPMVFDEWRSIRSEGVIFGKFMPDSDGKFQLELKFFIVQGEKRTVGKLFSKLQKEDVDSVLRRFADLCVKELTGEMGIFSTKIAFVASKKQGEYKQLYIANFDGSNIEQLTFGNSINMSPAWSPDGNKITYTSFKSGKAEIYVYNRLTKRTEQLTKSSGNNSGSNWHPEGKIIAFSSSVEGKTSVFTMKWDGSARSTLITGSGLEVEPAYSPEGKFIAFASGRYGNPHIFIREMASGKDARITTAGWYNSSPSWRPDSKKLAFAGYDRDINRYDIFTVNTDGTTMERLTLNRGDNEKPSWSPDGRFLVFQSNRGGSGSNKKYKLYKMNKDGGGVSVLDIPLYEISMPAWSPRINLLGD